MRINSADFCLLCSEIDAAECDLGVGVRSWQVGNTLFFSLQFSRPDDQIAFLVPLKYNVLATEGTNPVPLTERNGVFSLEIRRGFAESLQISVADKQLVKWRNAYLSEDPPAIRVSFREAAAIPPAVIEWFLDVASKVLFAGLILSAGFFSRAFEETNLLSFLLFAYSFGGNELGTVLHFATQRRVYRIAEADFWQSAGARLPVDARFAFYGLGAAFVEQTAPFLLALAAAVLSYFYARGYLRAKRSARKHFAFANFLDFGGEYATANVSAALSLLSFPALLQVRAYAALGWAVAGPSDFANLAAAVLVLLTPPVLFCSTWAVYPPKAGRRSVVYSELRPETKAALAMHVFAFVRPYLMAAALIWAEAEAARIVFLAANSVNIALTLANATRFTNKLSFGLRLLKCALAVFVNFAAHFCTDSGAVLLTAAAYCVLAVVSIEILEIVAKTILLILTNKRIIRMDEQTPILRTH